MPQYNEFRSKLYPASVSNQWFLARWPYLKFVLREGSSFFVAYFAVVLMLQISALNNGRFAYAAFQQCMQSPVMIVLNVVTLLFVVLHATTWFNLVPRVMMKHLTGAIKSDAAAALPGYVVWVAASLIVAYFILGA